MRRGTAVFLFSMLLTRIGFAQSVSFHVGTPGPGIAVSVPVGSAFSLRAGATYFTFSHSETATDEDVTVDFNGTLDWGGASVLGDWYPFRNGFRITAGTYYNFIRVSGTGSPIEPYYLNQGQANEKIIPVERLGTLSAELTYRSKINPYAGIGFGDGARGARLSFLVDVGVVYLGSPDLSMTGTGMISGTASQDRMLTEGLQSFRWLPVFSVGLAVRIGRSPR